MFELSIMQIHKKYKEGSLLPSQLVQYYLDKIHQFDDKTKAIIELNPKALDIAKSKDAELKKKDHLELLFGIPVIVKDNIDTAGEMATSAGSIALKNHYAKEDATVISRLKQEGAIILAKANLSEWANFRGKKSISGWSSRRGQTRNPFFLNRTPCGSSSGSAVAVAADYCTVAIGTETDGSIVCPSHVNGIVGVKPTMGLVSRKGIIPISHTQDTAGPMARSVKDAAILLQAISGSDPEDEITKRSENVETDFSNFEERNLDSFTVGIGRKFFSFAPKVERILNQTVKLMETEGTNLIDPVEIEIPEDGLFEVDVLLADYKQDLNLYLQSVDEKIGINSINDLIEFNKKHSEETMPFFGQEWLELALESEGIGSEIYQKAMTNYEKLRTNLRNLFAEHHLDAIFLPTGSPAWPIDVVNGDCSSGSTSFLAAVTGFPSITLPIGEIQGLPVGGTLLGLPFSEKTLFSLAQALELKLDCRFSPEFKEKL
ncbi:MAG: amidase [Methanobacteriota archaeon]|nr:MAG: amidase [Euryarchaeota archaeon]